jgi:hypothetical protein
MADILAAVLTDGLPLFGGDWVTGANFRNGSRAAVKPTSATRPLTHTNSRPLVALPWQGVKMRGACFAGRVGGAGNPDFDAPSADAPDSRVSWPHQSVLNINFALCCPIESKRKS